ncbi:uncharacterized protein SOCEGT47_038840 [Sorangium cellulosum]|uniref:Uncharacterized protein n=1 Tax=Sorangium cellulosum TaxID=56 RepID=A0A4P2Q2L9_SORCE|nr:hypothetical protein [Sorangium cellulosum]AUX23361.1 uncharacterized protein SOCEGT47_038840 [Sorangium cellulosum]
MSKDEVQDDARPELPVEVAEAVLDELRGIQAILADAERQARAWAERLHAASRPPDVLTP